MTPRIRAKPIQVVRRFIFMDVSLSGLFILADPRGRKVSPFYLHGACQDASAYNQLIR